ncbi:hypothetical protein ACOMHN_012657 [Nucella lapillus]
METVIVINVAMHKDTLTFTIKVTFIGNAVARGRVVRDDFEEFSSASEEEEDVIRYGPAAIDDLARYDMGRGVFRPLFLERFPEEDQQEPVARTARRVWFLLNGHANVKPMQRLISQKNYPNFERLLIDLSEKFPCAKSIKYIFRWPDRKEIKSVTEFENGCYYVCSRSKRVVSANYGNSKEQYWKGGKPRHQENFLFTDRDIGVGRHRYPSCRLVSCCVVYNFLFTDRDIGCRVVLCCDVSFRVVLCGVVYNFLFADRDIGCRVVLCCDVSFRVVLCGVVYNFLFADRDIGCRVVLCCDVSFRVVLCGVVYNFLFADRDIGCRVVLCCDVSFRVVLCGVVYNFLFADRDIGCRVVLCCDVSFRVVLCGVVYNFLFADRDIGVRRHSYPSCRLVSCCVVSCSCVVLCRVVLYYVVLCGVVYKFLFTDRDIGQVSSPQGHQMPKVVTVVSNVNRDSKASQRHTKQSRGLAPFPGGDFSPNRRYPLNRTGEPVRCDINGRKREFFGPSSGLHADADGKRPYKKFRLNWVYGYRGRDVRQNLVVLPETEELVYFVDSVVVLYDRDKHAQRYYMGHTDEITCLAIHPQEPHIASGQMAGKTPEGAAHVRVWNALHLTIISVLGIGAFQRGVSCVSFSERQYLLLAIDNSDHHVMSLWNCAEDQDRPLAQTKTTQELVVYGCFFPLDESILVTLGKQHLYFWKVFMDRPDGPIRRDTKSGIFEETPKFVTSVCFSPAGEVITGDSKGSVTVWSADNEDVFQIDQDASEPMTYAHKKSVSTLVMLSDRVLLSGGGNEIKAWDTRRGFLLIIARQLPQVHGAVRKIIPLFNSGMDALLLVGTVRNVILEGSLRSKFAVLVQGHSEELRAVKAHPVERSFFTAGHDKTLIKWSTHTHHPSWIATATAPCSSMSVDSRGVMVAVGMVTGELALYRGADGGQWKTLRVSKAQVNALAFSPDGQQLAAGCEDGFVYVCTIQDDKSIHRLRSAQLRHGTFVKALDWSTDGRYLQTVMGDYDVVFWDVKNMQKVQTMTYLRDVFWHTHSSPVGYPLVGPWRKLKRGEVITTACRSTDLDLVVTGDNVGRVRLFKYPSTALQPDCQQAKPFSCRVTAAEFVHKDCGVVVAGGSDAVLMQYDLDDR